MRARDAVGAGVATADHDHVLPACADRRRGRPGDVAVPSIQVLHREVHAFELAAGRREVAWHARADGEHDRVEALAELRRVRLNAEAKFNPLFGELDEAALDDMLLDLEIGHAEAEQAAACFVALEHGHGVTGSIQLLSAGEAGRSRADDRDAATATGGRGLGDDPVLLPGARHDRELDLLDRDRVSLLDLEHAGGLARRGAEAPRELREVVRAVELVDRLAEPVAIHEVVPVGNEIPERAAVMAERHAALHAARALVPELDERKRAHELAVVADALARNTLGRIRAVELLEASDLAHYAASSDSDSRVKRPWPPAETGWS